MNLDEIRQNLENRLFLHARQFEILAEVSHQLCINEKVGRDLLIHLLEYKECFVDNESILNTLVAAAGLFPYLEEQQLASSSEQLLYEFHRPAGLDDIVLHSAQMDVYQQLLDGENIILSAPTSFGKSLLIDAMIASGKYKIIVVIVPTIALIDETRVRLSERFRDKYKIITHQSQSQDEHSIYVLTQERFLEFQDALKPDFFVIDEFYKLNHQPESTSYDERVVSLNSAFLKLCNSKAQFLLIGPNISGVMAGKDEEIKYKFIRTDFQTVATDIVYVKNEGDLNAKCIELAQNLNEQTLIFCKSPVSAMALANKMIQSGLQYDNAKAKELATWLRENYHNEWDVPKFIEHGIAIHYSALPRSISHYILKLFNDGALRFVLCTSTIIEGVNTSAKNIIIFDNKIAKRKFDMFTYNNIKGRAGRMFRYFVGKVFMLNEQPDDQLPFIDIPVLTAPEDIPITLALDLPEHNLSEYTKEQLKKLHAQDYLDVSVIRRNPSVPADFQIGAAKEIDENIKNMVPLLTWTQNPSSLQLQKVCSIIFEKLLDNTGQYDIVSAKQLNYKIRELQHNMPNGIFTLIDNAMKNKKNCKDANDAVNKTLSFLRNWGEFNFPRLLNTLDDIQKYVFAKHKISPGDYSFFSEQVKHWFLPPAATLLEEYGIPFQITLKICKQKDLGKTPDEIISKIKEINIDMLPLGNVESSLLKEAILHL